MSNLGKSCCRHGCPVHVGGGGSGWEQAREGQAVAAAARPVPSVGMTMLTIVNIQPETRMDGQTEWATPIASMCCRE